MLIAPWALNNIINYKLVTICHKVQSDTYYHQTINKFEKLLE